MNKLFMPVWLFGWYLLAIGVGGYAAHYYLLSYPHYSVSFQMLLLILSTINVLLGLAFIFLRRILMLAIRLILFLMVKNMNKVFSEALRKYAEELGKGNVP